jgi:serine/threonine-protein kinase
MAVCPEESTLIAFSLGKLSPDEFDVIATHVSSCGDCGKLLSSLDSSDDSLVGHLRNCLSSNTDSPSDNTDGTAVGLDDETILESQPPGWVRHLGAYDIERVIGRGGMGMVFQARQRVVGRTVAIKTLDCLLLLDPEAVARFRTEAQAIGRLRHSSIVQVYEYGEVDGRPYLCMEFVSGPTLSAALAEGLPARDLAEVVRTIAMAVDYAHQQQVLHRDLKPSNVLVGKDGIKLTDFGLAKLVDVEEDFTRAGSVLGTACYMSPEQARGDIDAISMRTDVYGIGAILYEGLTGQPPYRGRSRAETLRQVQSLTPPRPRSLNPRSDRGLEAICLKCLEKVPSQRYHSAAGVADDLGRWLEGRPVVARRGISRYVTRRALAGVAVTFAVMAALITTVLTIQALSPAGQLRSIESSLAKGNEVRLLQEVGGPSWHNVPIGLDKTSITSSPDECFSVVTWDTCIVELVRDPQWPRFRLTADVRHDKGDRNGYVGLFVSGKASAQETGYGCIQMSFNDVSPMIVSTDDLPPNFKLPPPSGNVVRLFPNFCHQVAGGVAEMQLGGASGYEFTPAGFVGGPWHRLVIEVSEKEVSASWDQHHVGKQQREDIARSWRDGMKNQQFRQQNANRMVDFIPRGAVGVVASRSSASFRNVSVEPLR